MTTADLDERRTAIIRAVWQVMAKRGMSAVSMRTVAAAADVSVGRIQYWFHTKEELLRASLEAMLTWAEDLHAKTAQATDDHGALWHLISHPIPRAKAARAAVSAFHQYVAAAINHPDLARLLVEAKDGEEREAARLIGRIAPELDNPHTVAQSLVATADGLTMRVLLGGLTAQDAERTLRTAIDAALRPACVRAAAPSRA